MIMTTVTAAAVLLFILLLKREKRDVAAGGGRPGLQMKMGYILGLAGVLVTGASIALSMAIREEVEDVFFLVHVFFPSAPETRSEPYRMYAVLMCIAGLTALGIGMLNVYYARKKKE
jgi:multisubunit Na+/H+ antiporter MnhB subunit